MKWNSGLYSHFAQRNEIVNEYTLYIPYTIYAIMHLQLLFVRTYILLLIQNGCELIEQLIFEIFTTRTNRIAVTE
jgi:hypothetical protein